MNKQFTDTQNDCTYWEDSVIYHIAMQLDISESDAQAIFSAQMFLSAQCWAAGLNSFDTAKRIIKKSAS